MRNLSHPDELIFLAQIAVERRADVQSDQVHRTSGQIAEARAHAVEHGWGQAGHRQIEIGSRPARALRRRAKDISLLRARALEFGCGAFGVSRRGDSRIMAADVRRL